jgi:hypothetical protein
MEYPNQFANAPVCNAGDRSSINLVGFYVAVNMSDAALVAKGVQERESARQNEPQGFGPGGLRRLFQSLTLNLEVRYFIFKWYMRPSEVALKKPQCHLTEFSCSEAASLELVLLERPLERQVGRDKSGPEALRYA